MCFFFQAEDGIRDYKVTGVQTCALPIWLLQAAGGSLAEKELTQLLHLLQQRGLDPARLELASRAVSRTLQALEEAARRDRKSTRLNSSHLVISYAVFCLKKKRTTIETSVRTTGSTHLKQVSNL